MCAQEEELVRLERLWRRRLRQDDRELFELRRRLRQVRGELLRRQVRQSTAERKLLLLELLQDAGQLLS